MRRAAAVPSSTGRATPGSASARLRSFVAITLSVEAKRRPWSTRGPTVPDYWDTLKPEPPRPKTDTDTLVERVRGYISTGLSPNERADCTAALTELAERLNTYAVQANLAEARVAELEEALREIDTVGGSRLNDIRIARAALAKGEEGK